MLRDRAREKIGEEFRETTARIKQLGRQGAVYFDRKSGWGSKTKVGLLLGVMLKIDGW